MKLFLLLICILGSASKGIGQTISPLLDSLYDEVNAVAYGEVEKALAYAEEAMAFAKESARPIDLGMAYRIRGLALRRLERDREAIEEDRKAIQIHRLFDFPSEVAKDHINMGVAFDYLQEMDSALAHYFIAREIFEQEKDTLRLAIVLTNIAILYGNLGNDEQSLAASSEAKDIFNHLGKANYAAINWANMASSLHGMGDLQGAENACLEALEISKQQGDSIRWAAVKTKLASIWIDQERPQEALDMLKPVLLYLNGNDLRSYYINALFIQNTALVNLNEIRHSNVVLDTIERYALQHHDRIALRDLHYERYLNAMEQEQLSKAIENLKLYHSLKDSLVGESVLLETKTLEKKYETVKLRRELDSRDHLLTLERYQNDLQQSELSFFYTLSFFVFGFILLAATIIWLWVRQSRIKARYIQLDLEQKALKAQMNPHFLFNALNSIQSCILHEPREVAYTFHSKFTSLMRMVLMHSEQKVISLKMELAALDHYCALERLRSNGHFTYNIELGRNIDPSQVMVPSMLIQPFVENAIWHGIMNQEAPGEVKISIEEGDFYFKILINDNGVGREAARQIKSRQKVHHQSLGMDITRQRLKLYNFKRKEKLTIQIEDKVNEYLQPAGTLVKLYIPKSKVS